MIRARIIKQLLDNSTAKHTNGYVDDFKNNLIPTILVDDFFDNLNSGDGNELKSKFKALYSSSALGVNFFGFFKRHLDKFSLFGENGFTCGQFEKKLKTGLGGNPPNLDFYLQSDKCIIGIESKFLEPLSPKQPYFSASYSDSFLHKVDAGLPSIVNYYRINNSKSHLDTAQLIKHTIGLLNNKDDKRAKLIYVYWQPLNANDFSVYEIHRKELVDFAERIKLVSGISFHYLTYLDFYSLFANDNFFNQHLSHFKDKYLVKLSPNG